MTTKRYPNWIPYVLPYALFLLPTLITGEYPGTRYILYPLKTALAGAAVVYFWRAGDYPELDLRPSLLGIGAGLVGFALWVYPESLLSGIPKIGESSFNPYGAGDSSLYPVLLSRLAGAVIVVPVFEELFLRSFLHRWADDSEEDFREVPIGRYRLFAFLLVVAAMALSHHRWLRAGLYSALLCLVLYREKRMGSVIWAHAVTNLALAVYVLRTEEWSFW